jgi:hypothetical protein
MRLIAMLERSRSLLPYVAYRTALGTAALFALRRRARAQAGAPAAVNGHRPAAPQAGPNGRVHPAVVQ